MRFILASALFVLAACGSATDTKPVRYNFAVVAGMNQKAAAGDAVLGSKITAQLTRDPQGQFSVLDFLLPTKAYAQGISLAGDPVEGAIVCGREALVGEPQVQPLCAFTLADGKAANNVVPGTKAGTFNVVFTAQNVGTEPVKDSTTVVVEAGPFASTVFLRGNGFICWSLFPAINVLDGYGNAVPYRFVTSGKFAHVAGSVMGTEAARTLLPDSATDPAVPAEFQSIGVETATGIIATGKLTTASFAQNCVTLNF